MTNQEGWGYPANSRKAHYFVASRSLCLRWVFMGHLDEGNDASADNCAVCKRRLKERRPRRSDGDEG